MARPRKPTAILELHGAFKEHAARKAARKYEPKPTAPLGNPPKHLTPEQKKAWKELQKMTVPGVFTVSDRWGVELACVLITRLRAGNIKSSEMGVLTSLFGKFGLTPSDRSKVSVIPQPKQKEEGHSWADFAADSDEAVQ